MGFLLLLGEDTVYTIYCRYDGDDVSIKVSILSGRHVDKVLAIRSQQQKKESERDREDFLW